MAVTFAFGPISIVPCLVFAFVRFVFLGVFGNCRIYISFELFEKFLYELSLAFFFQLFFEFRWIANQEFLDSGCVPMPLDDFEEVVFRKFDELFTRVVGPISANSA